MYLSLQSIINAFERLKTINPFYGITYLACKKKKLPIGGTLNFSMDKLTKEFMNEYHRLCPESSHYFQPYKSNDRKKEWVSSYYPSKGLQSINTQTFSDAFIHSSGSQYWGWENNYIDILAKKLEGNLLPALELGIWFFRNEDLSNNITVQKLIDKFFSIFDINNEEKKYLFSISEEDLFFTMDFRESPVDWTELNTFISAPPDSTPPHGARLSFIETRNIGPMSHLDMEPGERLNLITGDNGLGKTFLLECSWFALTGKWPETSVCPINSLEKNNALISYKITGISGKPLKKTIIFDKKKGIWMYDESPSISGLFIYARVDGSYAIWDPLKQNKKTQSLKNFLFSKSEIWDGITGCIEGLIRDWVNWQRIKKDEFKTLKSVLEKMSPPDLGVLEPGEIIRILNDVRDMPTINHRYGNTPIIHASAGVKRIITLAYLVVWAWSEHKIQAKLQDTAIENRMVILIDEIEEHLHPKWQRVILPALLSIQSSLSKQLEIQFIISTHSPLILASSETRFDPQKDRLFHIKLEEKHEIVSMSEIDFIRYGQINSWLTSPIFNLGQARSVEAENAINKAKKLQEQNKPNVNEVRIVHNELLNTLAQEDLFWPRWIFFAEKNGLKK
jgi:AAA15 family ATPase/GTPase